MLRPSLASPLDLGACPREGVRRKPRAPGPVRNRYLGVISLQMVFSAGKDVITGERGEDRRARVPRQGTAGSCPRGPVLQTSLSAGPEEQPECGVREPGGAPSSRRFCWDSGGPSGVDTTPLHADAPVQLSASLWRVNPQNCSPCWPLPIHPASRWGGNKTLETTEERAPPFLDCTYPTHLASRICYVLITGERQRNLS